MILSQSDLRDKVKEVLEAVKKDQEATGSVQAMPQIVLVSCMSGRPILKILVPEDLAQWRLAATIADAVCARW